ncbi:MAG: VWA domain-containing protein [Deltaproteobacteria bacterium]|nr:VWA domain-containing protein [Deltaproteobacteria bacterium]
MHARFRPPFVTLVAALALLFIALALPAFAEERGVQLLDRVDLSDIRRGSLLIPDREHPGLYREAPAVETSFEVTVAGLVTRTTVRQRFTNPERDAVEMLYAFPLSETAAVDELKMIVGERVIEGQIAEKQAARRVYAAAKDEGKRASLVEQVRPNLFSTALANVAPGESIEVVIGTSDTLHYEAGRVTLRLPLSITPRFNPGGSGANAPVDLPATTRPTPVTIDIDVDAGFPVAGVHAPFHKVGMTKVDERGFVVASRGPLPADHDFVLSWDAKPLTAPTGAVFLEEHGKQGDGYALVMMVPPTVVDDDGSSRTPRDTVFIIDSSGSMSGPSMEQAKGALALAVQRIDPRDSFSIIDFDDKLIPMSSSLVPATAEHKALAARFVEGLVADGGTVMAPALKLAFEQIEAARAPVSSTGRVQQVIFMTDGAVSNEDELFSLIHDQLGKTRLFTVGIGAAPNTYFMRKAAEMGRGTFTYVGAPHEVEPKMTELFAKLESPVLSGIEVDFCGEHCGGGARVEAWPQKIPDLYLGEPLMVVARTDALPKDIVVTGSMAGRPYRVSFEVPWPVEGAGVHKLWARKKVDSLTDAMRTGKGGLEPEILAVALEHHIVSELTSLVAVDVTPVKQGDEVAQAELGAPVVPGMLPRGGTGWQLQLLVGALALVVAMVWARRGIA